MKKKNLVNKREHFIRWAKAGFPLAEEISGFRIIKSSDQPSDDQPSDKTLKAIKDITRQFRTWFNPKTVFQSDNFEDPKHINHPCYSHYGVIKAMEEFLISSMTEIYGNGRMDERQAHLPPSYECGKCKKSFYHFTPFQEHIIYCQLS